MEKIFFFSKAISGGLFQFFFFGNFGWNWFWLRSDFLNNKANFFPKLFPQGFRLVAWGRAKFGLSSYNHMLVGKKMGGPNFPVLKEWFSLFKKNCFVFWPRVSFLNTKKNFVPLYFFGGGSVGPFYLGAKRPGERLRKKTFFFLWEMNV